MGLKRGGAPATTGTGGTPSPKLRDAQGVVPTPLNNSELLRELGTFQIELEMQNEQLRMVQIELTESRDKYSDLYNFAPVGYATLAPTGLVVGANLTLCSLLGVKKERLINFGISTFIAAEDQLVYHKFFQSALKTTTKQSCELRLMRNSSERVWVSMQDTRDVDDNGEPARLPLAITYCPPMLR